MELEGLYNISVNPDQIVRPGVGRPKRKIIDLRHSNIKITLH